MSAFWQSQSFPISEEEDIAFTIDKTDMFNENTFEVVDVHGYAPNFIRLPSLPSIPDFLAQATGATAVARVPVTAKGGKETSGDLIFLS